MARIAIIEKKEDLQPEHQSIYDAIAQSRGVVGGPFVALLHSPELAGRKAAGTRTSLHACHGCGLGQRAAALSLNADGRGACRPVI